MKHFTVNLIAAAATFAAVAATASAQSHLTANIPFSFQVNSQNVLPAGEYDVMRVGSTPNAWAFEDRSTGKKTLVSLGHPNPSRQNDAPQLAFQCRSSHCGLLKIQVGYGEAGYEIKAPKSQGDSEEAKLVVVPLTRASAE